MNINRIQPVFTSKLQEKKPDKKDYLAMFYEKTKNAADMTDAILVPRTIFKGYLGIMAGTTMLTLGSLLSKHPKVSKSLSVAGALTSLYGTWAFVRPFIIKDSKGVTTKHDLENV